MHSTDLETVLRELALSIVRSVPRGSLSRAAASTLSTLERHGAQRITTLAESEAVSQPAMTTLVRRMEAAGLVSRQDDPDDARATSISITDDGRSMLQQRRHRYDELIAATVDRLTDEDRAAIRAARSALERFISSYEQPPL